MIHGFIRGGGGGACGMGISETCEGRQCGGGVSLIEQVIRMKAHISAQIYVLRVGRLFDAIAGGK